MIAIVDYGMGNVASIRNMLKRIGAEGIITQDPETIGKADKLVLPGVGAFDTGMRHIQELGLRAILDTMVIEKKVPVLGICLGMQLMTRWSEEGELPGLGWLAAKTVGFRFRPEEIHKLRIPHMGWNIVKPVHQNSLFSGMDPDGGYYFVHSYHVVCDREEDVLSISFHGHPFVSAVECGNVLGTQFHPEKSHVHGMKLLRNFVEF